MGAAYNGIKEVSTRGKVEKTLLCMDELTNSTIVGKYI